MSQRDILWDECNSTFIIYRVDNCASVVSYATFDLGSHKVRTALTRRGCEFSLAIKSLFIIYNDNRHICTKKEQLLTDVAFLPTRFSAKLLTMHDV
jgi:hypothetical protein